MVLFSLLLPLQLLLFLVLGGVSCWCWRQSRQAGFLLIAVGFLVLLLGSLIVLLRIAGFGYLMPLTQLTTMATSLSFAVLMFRGLRSLCEALPSPASAPREPLDPRQQWRLIRRAFFVVAGLALMLAAPPIAVIAGSGVGVAVVAAMTGVACLWLGLDRRSPLATSPIAPRS